MLWYGENFFSIKEEGNDESVRGGKNRSRKEKGKRRKGQYWENKSDTDNMNERQAQRLGLCVAPDNMVAAL